MSEGPYDALVLGAGWGGLVTASLLAKAGKRVCVLEAQDRAGGCGQSFTRQGFSFCAEMQYFMGCAPGGIVNRFLRTLNLEHEVTFNELDPEGYDRVEFPGFSFRIPHDAHRLQEALKLAFPEEVQKVDAVFEVLFKMEAEIAGRHFDARTLLLHPFDFKDSILFGPWPAERVFDHFGLSPQLRAVLSGQCGDVGLGPRDAPFFALQAVLLGYCGSAHFPKKGMGHFVDTVTAWIQHHGGELHYGAKVTGLDRAGDRITGVETTQGVFTAPTIISNIDPALTLAMVAGAEVPAYEQSGSCFTLFVGLDEDLGKRGFGRSNIWHFPSEHVDAAIDRSVKEHQYDDPFFFLSTPSLCADPGVLAPPGCTTVQINVGSSFDYFAEASRNGTHAQVKERVANEVLAAVERRCVKGLKEHLVFQEAWSPVDLAGHTGLARGGMYGARLDFENRVLKRVRQKTRLENLFLTNATAGGPGLQGAIASATKLVEVLLEPR